MDDLNRDTYRSDEVSALETLRSITKIKLLAVHLGYRKQILKRDGDREAYDVY